MNEIDKKVLEIMYGLGEYSKIPYEARLSLVKEFITIKPISKEVANKIIYKIEEQLRIRTSNLNRAINNPKRKITKKEVLEFINEIQQLVEKNTKETPTSKVNTDFLAKEEDLKIKKLKTKNKEEGILSLYRDRIINLKKFDLILIKKITSFIFSDLKKEGVNIITKKDKTFIIPRTTGDNKIKLKRTSKKEIKEIYKAVLKTKENKKEDPTKEEENEYKEIKEEIEEIKTTQKDDLSLENLLSKQEKEFVPIKSNDGKIEIERDNERITIEKEPKKEIEIIKSIETNDDELVIFLDEKAKAVLSKKKPLGRIEIEIRKNDLEDFTYGLVLSKYFSILIFNTLKCEGTNVIYKNNKYLIVPRFQEDNLINLKRKEVQKRDLDIIYKKLTEENPVPEKQNTEIKIEKEPPKKEETQEDKEVKEKAREILERLRRIP